MSGTRFLIPDELRGYYSGVGSREAPADALRTMKRFGKVQCDLGWRGRSGCAPGADTAFWEGAKLSDRYPEVGFDNFLPNEWMFNCEKFGFITPDPPRRIFDAKTFVDVYERAKELAFEARGSFEGLGRGGIELHTRNAMQVLGEGLNRPSRGLVCWALPVGRQGKVKGGTNTAVQLAIQSSVEVINIYKDADRERIEAYLVKWESQFPNAFILE